MQDIKSHNIRNDMETTQDNNPIDIITKTDRCEGPSSLYVENVFVDFAKVDFPDLIEYFLSF